MYEVSGREGEFLGLLARQAGLRSTMIKPPDLWIVAMAFLIPACAPARSATGVSGVEQAYLEADQMVERLILSLDMDRHGLKEIRLGDRVFDTPPTICDLILRPLKHRSQDTPAELWVAAVTIWTGSAMVDTGRQNSLRLYRRKGGRVLRVAATDDTPLIHAVKSGDAPTGLQQQADCLCNAIRSIGVWWQPGNEGAECAEGWQVRAEYESGGGAQAVYYQSTVQWLIRDDRFHAVWAEGGIRPVVLSGRHGPDIAKRFHFNPCADELQVKREETLSTFLDAADTLMAVTHRMLPSEQAQGLATPEQVSALAPYIYDDWVELRLSGDVRPSLSRIEIPVFRFGAGREAPPDAMGWLVLEMKKDDGRWRLETFSFLPAEDNRPSWDDRK